MRKPTANIGLLVSLSALFSRGGGPSVMRPGQSLSRDPESVKRRKSGNRTAPGWVQATLQGNAQRKRNRRANRNKRIAA